MLDGDQPTEADIKQQRLACMDLIGNILVGDWRREVVQCLDDGRPRAEQVEKVVAAIWQGGLLLGQGLAVPSKNRLGSCSEHLAIQSAGHMAHNILHRVLRRTHPKWDAIALDDDDGDDDFRKRMRSKAQRAVQSTIEAKRRGEFIMHSWLCHPLDRLWMRLQFNDERGSSLFDAIDPRSSPFVACQHSFADMLTAEPSTGPLSDLFWYLGPRIVPEVRRCVLSMSGMVWHYFECTFASYPYLLLDLVHPRREDSVLDIAAQFIRTPKCDLDAEFSLKLKTLFPTAEAIVGSHTLLNALRNFGRKAKLTNMHLERLLSRVKRATPGKLPMAERLLNAGYVGEFIRQHTVDHGGHDPRYVDREQILDLGAPLRCRRATPSGRGGLTAPVAFANQKISEWKQDNSEVQLDKPAVAAKMREFVAEFQRLSEDDKQEYFKRAKDSRKATQRRLQDDREIQETRAAVATYFPRSDLALGPNGGH